MARETTRKYKDAFSKEDIENVRRVFTLAMKSSLEQRDNLGKLLVFEEMILSKMRISKEEIKK